MLVAYLDEIGETGAYISHDHERFNTSPAFGYAGFVIPDDRVREFGSNFTHQKRQLFKHEIAQAEAKKPGSGAMWEKKGAEYFHKRANIKNIENLRVFDSLVNKLLVCGGRVFYYADEKERGTPKQTRLDMDYREESAMAETLNRLARCAEKRDQNMLVMIDQINEKERKLRAHRMYGHVYSRSQTFGEMKRIIEAPMHLDSGVSGSIQFADWIAAAIGRAIDYQLEENSKFDWIPDAIRSMNPAKRAFTFESKLHLFERAIEDINHSGLLNKTRHLYPPHHGQYVDPEVGQKMNKIAYSARNRRRSE